MDVGLQMLLERERWRQQQRTEMELLNGVEWCVAYVPPGATIHKSSKSFTLNTHDSNTTRCQVVAQLNNVNKHSEHVLSLPYALRQS